VRVNLTVLGPRITSKRVHLGTLGQIDAELFLDRLLKFRAVQLIDDALDGHPGIEAVDGIGAALLDLRKGGVDLLDLVGRKESGNDDVLKRMVLYLRLP